MRFRLYGVSPNITSKESLVSPFDWPFWYKNGIMQSYALFIDQVLIIGLILTIQKKKA